MGKKKTGNIMDRFAGDKVIWMILILLILFSLVTIFSSTSLLASMQKTDRVSILKEQSVVVLLGLALVILCYSIKRVSLLRTLSKYGFAVSFVLLALMAVRTPILPFIVPKEVNHAWRILVIGGFQLHVFEVVKVAMVMYLSWAVDAYRFDGFHLSKRLARHPRLKFFETDLGQRVFYIYIPIIITCGLILTGSVSSALFIGLIFFATILIGGISIKDVVYPGIAAVVLLTGAVLVYQATGWKALNRLGTAASRITSSDQDLIDTILDPGINTNSKAYTEAVDDLRQPYSAKLAIRQGGLIGKGPGESTQRDVVPIMYSDYMYSFIIEEYGLLGGVFIIILFSSLLARGAMIAGWLDDYFAKTAVAGLVVLTVGQAFMHMAINLDLVPRTGQTLPLISHGNTSFLAFSIVFGIILSLSREAKKNHADRLAAETEKAGLPEAEETATEESENEENS